MKQKLITFGLIVFVLLAAAWFFEAGRKPSTGLEATTDTGAQENKVQGLSTATVRLGSKTYEVELSVTSEQQARGLSNRDSMSADHGMLFVFKPAQTPSFWMKGMKFPLDTVWIYQERVIGIEKNLPVPALLTPPEELPLYRPNSPVDYVLELNAGQSANFKVGDRVEILDSLPV